MPDALTDRGCPTAVPTSVATPSVLPIARTSSCLPLNANEEVRAATLSSLTCASLCSRFSVSPSEKYSLSLSEDMFTNGSTAVERSPSVAWAPA